MIEILSSRGRVVGVPFDTEPQEHSLAKIACPFISLVLKAIPLLLFLFFLFPIMILIAILIFVVIVVVENENQRSVELDELSGWRCRLWPALWYWSKRSDCEGSSTGRGPVKRWQIA